MALPIVDGPKRPRGRPRRDNAPAGSVQAPRPPAHGERGFAKAAEVVTTARRTDASKATNPEVAEAIAVLASRPELRFLERAERLAWLCERVDQDHTETKAFSTPDGIETIDIPTEAPQFKAMEMLQRALGDYHHAEGTKILNVVGSQSSGEVRRVIRLYLPPPSES